MNSPINPKLLRKPPNKENATVITTSKVLLTENRRVAAEILLELHTQFSRHTSYVTIKS